MKNKDLILKLIKEELENLTGDDSHRRLLETASNGFWRIGIRI